MTFSDGQTQRRTAGPWTERDPVTGAPPRMWFVGSGTYRATADLPDGDRVTLDLGAAGDVADVSLGGTPPRTRAWPPYAFDVTSSGGRGVALEVTVTTSQAASFPNDPRYPAGLLGPVTVRAETLVRLVP